MARVAILRIGPRVAGGVAIGVRLSDDGGGFVDPEATATVPEATWDDLDFAQWNEVDPEDRRKLGERLFGCLVGCAPGAAWAAQRSQGDLRTFFQIELDGDLPVEILRDPKAPIAQRDVFVRAPFFRVFLDKAAPLPPPRGLLRVLVVVGPPGPKDISSRDERNALVRSLSRRRNDVDLRCLVHPKRQVVSEHLAALDWQPHVIHFVGHGAASPAQLLVGSPDAEEPWTYTQIAQDLEVSKLRPHLVVLNACKTFVEASRSIARVFLEAGADHVIATGADIDGPTALRVAEQLYGRLAEGLSVPAMVDAARRALYRDSADRADWAIPQYVVRARDTDLCTEHAPLLSAPAPLAAACDGADFAGLDRFVDQRRARAHVGTRLIEGSPKGRVVVLRGPDLTGKSTVMRWLAETAVRWGSGLRFVGEGEPFASELAFLRRIRDGVPPDPAAREAFKVFTFTTYERLHGRHPDTSVPFEIPDDSALSYDAQNRPLDDWLGHAQRTFVEGLLAYTASRRLLVVVERFDKLPVAIRPFVQSFLVEPVLEGRLPAVSIALGHVDALDIQGAETIQLSYPELNALDAWQSSEAWQSFEDYVSLHLQRQVGLTEETQKEWWSHAENLFRDQYLKKKRDYRLSKLPRLLELVTQLVEGV